MLLLFSIGIGFILSAVSVFLRDMLYIYGIILTIWQYLTPIFWNMAILPESYHKFFQLNPLYQYLTGLRDIVLSSNFPGWINLGLCGIFGIGTFIIGSIVFRKSQDKFIYYS
jgi:ABC-2 type transport system permease protein